MQTPSFASPRAGAALQAFSGDELVFNDTMKDWRTHNGMDLAGAAGDAVTAPTGAVVARAYEDPQWGGVVELNAGKLTVRVCGLADIAVKEGDTVAVGDQRNDLEMLDWAARGVAMGQAPDEVKAAADEVTGTVEEHGLAQLLRTLEGVEAALPVVARQTPDAATEHDASATPGPV